MTLEIRPFTDADWPAVWPTVRDIVQAQETFTYDPAMTEAQARAIWVEHPPGLTVVACEGDRVLGTAKMGANRAGPGAHVATASYMVDAAERGRGVGGALVQFTLDWARQQGFEGIQFNAVAASNSGAVALYQRLGFDIVGSVPGAFKHPALGRVDLLVMYQALG